MAREHTQVGYTELKKGLRVYVKEPGKRRRYYVPDANVPLDAYKLFPNAQDLKELKKGILRKRGKRSTQTYRKYQRYITKLKKEGNYNTLFKAGSVSSALFNPFDLTKERVKALYTELLTPAVIDAQLLEKNIDVIMKNAPRMRHRFWFSTAIIGRNESGQQLTLATINDEGRRTLEEYQRDYLTNGTFKVLKRGNTVDSSWGELTRQHLRIPKKWLSVLQSTSGRVTGAQTHITFLKG